MIKIIVPAFWFVLSILNSWVAIYTDNQQEILILIIDAIFTFTIGVIETLRMTKDEQF